MKQEILDKHNAEFWNEACGTTLAKRTGTEDNFGAFDEKYFELYPYLKGYLRWVAMTDNPPARLLEVGTGYGSVAFFLDQFTVYTGLDIAPGPVMILKRRGIRGKQGNVLDMPFPDRSFNAVVSIGCLHHVGDIPGALKEIRRVLCKGGKGLFMFYNKDADWDADDSNAKGEQPPHTEYVSFEQLPKLFSGWKTFSANVENKNDHDIYVKAVK